MMANNYQPSLIAAVCCQTAETMTVIIFELKKIIKNLSHMINDHVPFFQSFKSWPYLDIFLIRDLSLRNCSDSGS